MPTSFQCVLHRLVATVCMFLAGTCSWAADSVVTVLAADSFSYPGNVALPGQNGGTGWSGAWVSDSVSFTDFYTNAASLAVTGVASAGGRAVYRAGSQLNDAARTLPLQNTGVVFVQFLAQFGTQSGGGTPNIRFSSSGALTGAVGNNGACGSAVYAILNNNLQAIPASCSAVTLATLSAVVLRIDYTANNTRMWVLPGLSGFDYLNPPTASAEYDGLAPAFDRLSFYTRNPANIDELRIFRVDAVVDGECGGAAGQAYAFAPTAQLCTQGTPSVVVSDPGKYSWVCSGSNGGAASGTCEANWAVAGTGTGSVAPPDNGWAVTSATFSNTLPGSPPANASFPYGLVSLSLNGGAVGSATSITIHYTTPVPVGAVYMKYGKSPAGFNCSGAACAQDHWYLMPEGQVVVAPDRYSATLTITDGGAGDDDLIANGAITDPGGFVLLPAAIGIPSLSQWALFLTAILMVLGSTHRLLIRDARAERLSCIR